MKPLYLLGRKGMRVVFDEPALAVCVTDKTRQLFPLPRISRVVVCGNVEWSMGALFACADAGVSVVFLDQAGKVRSCWLGLARQKCSVLQSLCALLEQTEALPRYQNWLLGMRRMAARSAAKRLAFADWQTVDAAALEAWSQQSINRDWLIEREWLQGVILSAVMQYLLNFGIDAKNELSGNAAINLADDLTRLLALDFLPELLEWQKWFFLFPEKQTLVQLFEQRSRRLEYLLRGCLNKLHLCLRERR